MHSWCLRHTLVMSEKQEFLVKLPLLVCRAHRCLPCSEWILVSIYFVMVEPSALYYSFIVRAQLLHPLRYVRFLTPILLTYCCAPRAVIWRKIMLNLLCEKPIAQPLRCRSVTTQPLPLYYLVSATSFIGLRGEGLQMLDGRVLRAVLSRFCTLKVERGIQLMVSGCGGRLNMSESELERWKDMREWIGSMVRCAIVN